MLDSTESTEAQLECARCTSEGEEVISTDETQQILEKEKNIQPKKSNFRFFYCLDFPIGTWMIFMNEFGERFCFYGFKTILSLYFVKFLLFKEDQATSVIHLFIFASYLTPLLGGYISDVFLGKYWTIVSLSFIYCIGQTIIAVTAIPGVTGTPPHWWGAVLGLFLVSIGTGGIKPCVSSFGADQFHESQKQLMSSYFAIFYLMINIGGLISAFLTPLLSQLYGWAVAFAVPAIVLFGSSIIFALGYKTYEHVKPNRENIVNQFVKIIFYGIYSLKGGEPVDHWLDRCKTRFTPSIVEDVKSALSVAKCLSPLFIFWALYDQYGTRWVFQAEKMNRVVGGYEFDAGQITVLNSLFVLFFVPIFDYLVYPAFNKCFNVTLLKKMVVGFMITAISFVAAAIVQFFVDLHPNQIHVAWQIPQYLLLTFGEIMVSITGLEFSYSQSPASMKSIMASFFLMTVAAGNMVVAIVADLPIGDGLMFKQVYEFLFYSVTIILFMFVFLIIIRDYQYKADIEIQEEMTQKEAQNENVDENVEVSVFDETRTETDE